MRFSGVPSAFVSSCMLGLTLIVFTTLAPNAGAQTTQYRETDSQFVSRLFVRIEAVEARIKELEVRLSTTEARRREGENAASMDSGDARQVASKSADEAGGAQPAETRAPERLRHKNRAVDAEVDELARIKVRLGLLHQEAQETRKALAAHELTHVVQQRAGARVQRSGRAELERSLQDIDSRLAGLSADLMVVERAQVAPAARR